MPGACPRPGEDSASASGRGQAAHSGNDEAQGIVPTHGAVRVKRPVFLRLQKRGAHPRAILEKLFLRLYGKLFILKHEWLCGGRNMSSLFEERESDSPYIEAVWRGRAGSDYAPVCPASNRWHLLFLKQNGAVKVSVEGPLTKATPVTQAEGTEWFGVTFQPGFFLSSISIRNLVDERAILPLAAKTSFELAGSSFQFPDYENVETFVERLVRQDLLVSDPVVKAVLAGQPPQISLRTVRRRFLLATGLTFKAIEQIERAKQAVALLEQGVSLLDTAYQVGYADQSHMTRSLKHFIGSTPAHIAQIVKPK